jgi:tetratricopeptide (TPR) repeat protein
MILSYTAKLQIASTAFFFCFFLQLFSPCSIVHAASPSNEEIYSQATLAFREANALMASNKEEAEKLYAQAALRFEKLIHQRGIKNGQIYYNLGNTYFLLGDLGRAILNYLRAKQYSTKDTNLMQNLSYARSRRVDRMPEFRESDLHRTLLFWHYDIPSSLRLSLLAVCYILFWLSLISHLRKSRFPANRVFSFLTALLSLVFAGSLIMQEHHLRQRDVAVIIAPEVMPRKGDGHAYEPSFHQPLHAGTELRILEHRPGWFYVELANAQRGWLPEGSIDIV